MGNEEKRKYRKKKRFKKSKLNWRKALKRTTLIALLLFTIAAIVVGIYVGSLIYEVKDFDPENFIDYNQTSFVFDKDGNVITDVYGVENRVFVNLKDVPKHVQDAFVAVEDVRFYKHRGFDIKRMFGALFQNIKAGRIVAGAGTITQQVIRNTFLTQEQTVKRKIQEIYLAYRLEKEYSKDQILEMYLNIIYFAEGAYGIEAASRTYFDKNVSELTVAEGAVLVGIVKNPHRNSPFINVDRALERKNINIDVMVKNNKLTKEKGERAKNEEIQFAEKKEKALPHGYFIDLALEEASDILNINEQELYTAGYRIYTTLDTHLQNHVEQLHENEDMFPKSPKSGKAAESALVILDNETGEIRSLLGGRTYPEGHRKVFNRALNRRQPASTMKPLVAYGPAIENYNYSGATLLDDTQVTIGNYKPTNYDHQYRGLIPLRFAIAKSINVPAVKVLNEIGLRNGVAFAEKLGISFTKNDKESLTIALGGMEEGVSPLELARAYSVYADKGIYKECTTIKRIEDPFGIVLYEHRPVKKQVISEEAAFIISDILKSTTQEGGTATRLGTLNIPIAAKTGTAQLPGIEAFRGVAGANDLWTAAYNPEYTIVSWMGFDSPWEGNDKTTPQHYLPAYTGGKNPTEMVRTILSFIYQDGEAPDFVKPPRVVEVKLDNKALWDEKRLLVASPLTPDEFTQTEYFIEDNVPSEESDYWKTPDTPYGFNVGINNNGLPEISFVPRDTFAVYYIYRTTNDGSDSEPVLVHQTGSSPNLDRITWVDQTAEQGHRLGYFVVPVHPELKEDGQPLQGVPTQTKYVDVPYKEDDTDGWDWRDWFNGWFNW